MGVVIKSVDSPYDFVRVDRSESTEIVIHTRIGMAANRLTHAVAVLLTTCEREQLRAAYGLPPIAEQPDVTRFLPSEVEPTDAHA